MQPNTVQYQLWTFSGYLPDGGMNLKLQGTAPHFAGIMLAAKELVMLNASAKFAIMISVCVDSTIPLPDKGKDGLLTSLPVPNIGAPKRN